MIRLWLLGSVRRRAGRLTAAGLGVAIAVALLASLGAFLAHAKATMTSRAIHGVAVDWQVQVQPGADPAKVGQLLRDTPAVAASVRVGIATTSGLSAETAGSTQTTGPGVVLGLDPAYPRTFPGELRLLTGTLNGPLLAQQTAANLHAGPGDVVTVGWTGLPPVQARIAGVVELPLADSLFQVVGAPATAQRTAPPDNVLLLPSASWQSSFEALRAARPDLVTTQFHVATTRALPADPAAAYTAATGAANNFLAHAAGTAAVGDNLAATLDAARQDAAYAQVLFLFLGLPGAILAALLTAVLATAGRDRRRLEQALLRARGATTGQLTRLAAVEAGVVAGLGAVVGLATAAAVGAGAFGTARFGATTGTAVAWGAAAAVTGLLIAILTVLVPAWRDLRAVTVASARRSVTAPRYPLWARYGVDALALAVAGLVFSASGRNGYQLVVAPEGVPMLSVSYWAFAGPALLWLGAGLLVWRAGDLLLGRGRRLVAAGLGPFTGRLHTTIASGMSRQRRPLALAIVLLTLALSFAGSTAVFNATYRQQAEADAQLTNGADVTAVPAPGTTLPAGLAGRISAIPGVRAVEPVQHRFAYVGPDLQDLYGVRPGTIRHATALRDSYFSGGTAAGLTHLLAAQPDAILVSAETVRDYQLAPGDALTLRLLSSGSGQRVPVRFRFVGVVSEFPMAPKDSFFVANADYVARQTGDAATGAFLIDTGGRNASAVARAVASLAGPSATVTDITTVRHSVGSSLTSVDLAGLTRVELAFALVLATAAGGLAFGLGLSERRRTFAVITALGARPRHLRAMILSEAAAVSLVGVLAGAAAGTGLSFMLVKVLTGVFDPPPSALAVPWAYLLATAATAVVALFGVAAGASHLARRPAMTLLHDL
ncbi:ABC transporter permease [Frankia sp. AgB1.9]|uniref:ABC transporter permease n=1 Tax=unclassified Frankia TaxID=2632575 RepID=UPI0019343089|nr:MULTISPECIES: ABC transporter permease [unclassified Frankia]MBL7552134.1 ABC transporter permease [Frankia sp. AgB1.9]MBL7622147.1 ABC transporter permease [Frankia sp. AgB1.8]